MTPLIAPAAFAAGVVFSAVFRRTASIRFIAPLLGRALAAPVMLLAYLFRTLLWVLTGERSKQCDLWGGQ